MTDTITAEQVEDAIEKVYNDALASQDGYGSTHDDVALIRLAISQRDARIAELEADNKRLLEVALSRSIEVTSYRSALMQIKSAQERYVYGEVSPGVPAYKMLEAWQIADKALTQTDRKENE